MGLQNSDSSSVTPTKVLFNRFLIFQISFPFIGGFLFGYNTGVISGALLFLKVEFTLSVFDQELLVAITIVAAVIGAILGGVLSEKFGRRPTILFSGIIMMCGAIVMGMAITVTLVIIGRAIVGLGIGISSSVCPIYIAEIAPQEIRGRLIVLYQIMIAGGQFLASIVNASFFYFKQEKIWRFTLGFAAIPAFIQAFGVLFIPESHRWLLSKDKLLKAKKVIKLEGRVCLDMIDDYVDEILISNELSIKDKELQHSSIFWQILCDKTARHLLLIGCGIQIIQQLTGINGVIYYSSAIITNSGIIDPQRVLWYTSLVMLCCTGPVVITYFLIDRIGRRKLAMWSLVGIVIGSIILAVGFQIMYYKSQPITDHIKNQTNDIECYPKQNCEECVTLHNCGYCSVNDPAATYCLTVNPNRKNESLDGPCSSAPNNSSIVNFKVGYCSHIYAWIVVLGLAVYLFSFAVGMGPVPWVLTSEIYPLWCRGICMAISTTVNWVFNILISMTFLSLTEWITRFGAFWLFAGLSFCSIGIIYKCILETNQLALEDVPLLLGHEE